MYTHTQANQIILKRLKNFPTTPPLQSVLFPRSGHIALLELMVLILNYALIS